MRNVVWTLTAALACGIFGAGGCVYQKSLRGAKLPTAVSMPTLLLPVDLGPGDVKMGFLVVGDFGPTAPESGELAPIETLSGFAARGQTISIPFGVYALRDLSEVTCAVSKIKGGQGETLPMDKVNCRFGAYEHPADAGESDGSARLGALYPWGIASLQSGALVGGRLELTVPLDAQAVTYIGTLEIRAANAGKRSLMFATHVLPFVLPESDGFEDAPACRFGKPALMAYHEARADALLRDMAVMRELGLAPYLSGLATADKAPKAAVEEFVALAKRLRESGYAGAIGWDDTQLFGRIAWDGKVAAEATVEKNEALASLERIEAFKEALQELRRLLPNESGEARKIFLTASRNAGVEFGLAGKDREQARLMMAGVMWPGPCLLFPGEAWEAELAGERTSLVLGRNATGDYETMSRLRAEKTPMVLAPLENVRFATGFFAWRAGLQAVICGSVGATPEGLGNDASAAIALAEATPAGLLPTGAGEAVREGADDLRCLLLLDALMKEGAKGVRVDKLAEAMKTAEELRARMEEEIRLSWAAYAETGGPDRATLERMRWAVTRAIVGLQEALKRG